MRTKTIEKVVTYSIVYGYAITQPFSYDTDLQSLLQDKLLAEGRTLQYGENREIVRHIQQRYDRQDDFNNRTSGTFSLLKADAKRGYQSSHDVKITGKDNQKAMKKLLSKEKQVHMDEIEELIDTISYGDISNDVIQVQEVLLYYGYYKGNIDGIYGPLTADAILQVKNEYNYMEENIINVPIQTLEDGDQVEEIELIQVEIQENSQAIAQYARTYIGTPYIWGGVSPKGFDCSGFIQYVYEKHNKVIPRTVNDIWNFSSPITSPSIGDLVFFETYKAGPSHLGIYLGNGDFIHAGSSRGVEVSNFTNNEYWSSRYLGAKRIDL